MAVTSAPAIQAQEAKAIVVDPEPLFEISPLLYMQFMEPLGMTDCAVEASWDYNADDWRSDFVAISRDLAPGAIRFGGLFSRYYRWREGVGRAAQRPWMRNYVWSGKETNRVGMHEFVDFCRRVGAEPFYCVNFLSDGEKCYGNRTADAQEAADWVSYANDPDHRQRRTNGAPSPLNPPPKRPDTALRGLRYQRDPQRAWEELIELADAVERRVFGRPEISIPPTIAPANQRD